MKKSDYAQRLRRLERGQRVRVQFPDDEFTGKVVSVEFEELNVYDGGSIEVKINPDGESRPVLVTLDSKTGFRQWKYPNGQLGEYYIEGGEIDTNSVRQLGKLREMKPEADHPICPDPDCEEPITNKDEAVSTPVGLYHKGCEPDKEDL